MNKKELYIRLLFGVGLSSIILLSFLFTQNDSDIQSPSGESTAFGNVIKLKRTIVPETDASSRIYTVTNTQGESFLLSTDSEIHTQGEYTLEEIHRHVFWNPVTCARVPFVKKDTSFYFLELSRIPRGDNFFQQKTMYVLDTESHSLISYTMPYNTVGYVYSNGGSIYVALPTIDAGMLEGVEFYMLNEESDSLIGMSKIDLASYNIRQPTYRKFNDNFAISFYDDNVRSKNLIFDGSKFIEGKIEPDETISYEDQNFKVYDTKSSQYLRKHNIINFGHIQVTNKENERVAIEMHDNTVNKYIISDI